ncbi:MAG: hypothetical protein N2509_08180, partial [Treponemataceae bacterium]|nr:hypothetical protein [Treponemataceae bacterium]
MEQGRWKVPPEMPDGEGSLFVSKEGPMEDMSYGAEENLSPQVWTVSELTERIRACLEGFFPLVIVEGEISNYRP